MIARQSGRPQFTHPWALSDQRSRQLPMSLPGRCQPICPITAEPRFQFQTPLSVKNAFRADTRLRIDHTKPFLSSSLNHSTISAIQNPGAILMQSKNLRAINERWAGEHRTRAGGLMRKVRPSPRLPSTHPSSDANPAGCTPAGSSLPRAVRQVLPRHRGGQKQKYTS